MTCSRCGAPSHNARTCAGLRSLQSAAERALALYHQRAPQGSGGGGGGGGGSRPPHPPALPPTALRWVVMSLAEGVAPLERGLGVVYRGALEAPGCEGDVLRWLAAVCCAEDEAAVYLPAALAGLLSPFTDDARAGYGADIFGHYSGTPDSLAALSKDLADFCAARGAAGEPGSWCCAAAARGGFFFCVEAAACLVTSGVGESAALAELLRNMHRVGILAVARGGGGAGGRGKGRGKRAGAAV